jgi:hypothetical protein
MTHPSTIMTKAMNRLGKKIAILVATALHASPTVTTGFIHSSSKQFETDKNKP